MRRRETLKALAAISAMPMVGGCESQKAASPGSRPSGKLHLVFKHQPLWGDPAPFRDFLGEFERDHPDIAIVTEPLPNASDLMHQFFLTALEAGADEFDVFVADVIWVAEFARAGWIADLSDSFSPTRVRRDFVPGAASAAIIDEKTFGVPWYVDVGVLHYRTDLVDTPPTTYAALSNTATALIREGRVTHGYVWQGRQYEGLVCNVYECIWGYGGQSMDGQRIVLDSPAARAALDTLRGFIETGVSPRSVTSMAEEESRRVFQDGRAAFMRNWPYAFNEAQREGSPIRGKVAMAALPTQSGATGHGALGGFQLLVNAHSPMWKREAAMRFIEHMTSDRANRMLALAYGRNPARRDPYSHETLRRDAPAIVALAPMLENAKPRPVSPYYPMASDALQGEMSAAVSGIRSPGESLRRAQAFVDHLVLP